MGALRLVHARRAPGGESATTADAWLDMLTALLDLPKGERAAIRDELAEHLRERTRDLMVAGAPEAEAARQAIEELGDAAGVARRFRFESGRKVRRSRMNIIAVGAAGLALATSVATFTLGQLDDGPVAISVFKAPESGLSLGAARISVSNDTTWGDFFAGVGKAAGKPVTPYWFVLRSLHGDQMCIDINEPIGTAFEGLTIPQALQQLSEEFNLSPMDGLDLRVTPERIEIAPATYFDRREMSLATYDLSPIIKSQAAELESPEGHVRAHVMDQATMLVRSIAYPEMWRDNGGDLAHCQVMGSKLFIEAPARVHVRVRWVLGELVTGDPAQLKVETPAPGGPR